MNAMTPLDLGWVVGLFEGEGCFHTDRKRGELRMSLNSTDEDVVRHLHLLIGIGTVGGPYKSGKGVKPLWTWGVGGEPAVTLARAMLPYLGIRRSAKIRDLLANRADRREDMLKPRVCPNCKGEFQPIKLRPGVHFVVYCSPKCHSEWRNAIERKRCAANRAKRKAATA